MATSRAIFKLMPGPRLRPPSTAIAQINIDRANPLRSNKQLHPARTDLMQPHLPTDNPSSFSRNGYPDRNQHSNPHRQPRRRKFCLHLTRTDHRDLKEPVLPPERIRYPAWTTSISACPSRSRSSLHPKSRAIGQQRPQRAAQRSRESCRPIRNPVVLLPPTPVSEHHRRTRRGQPRLSRHRRLKSFPERKSRARAHACCLIEKMKEQRPHLDP